MQTSCFITYIKQNVLAFELLMTIVGMILLTEPMKELCQICGDNAAGFHCGAFVCEACKKFYVRASKHPTRTQVCSNAKSGSGPTSNSSCAISKQNRTACSYCRYQKCLSVGMEPPGLLCILLSRIAVCYQIGVSDCRRSESHHSCGWLMALRTSRTVTFLLTGNGGCPSVGSPDAPF